MNGKDINYFINLPNSAQKILNNAARSMDLSPRAYHRVLKLSRTIADLSGSETVEENHILEALQYRPKQIQEL